jgi:hypothetical protein
MLLPAAAVRAPAGESTIETGAAPIVSGRTPPPPPPASRRRASAMARALPLVGTVGLLVAGLVVAAVWLLATPTPGSASQSQPSASASQTVNVESMTAIIGLSEDNKENVLTLCWRASTNPNEPRSHATNKPSNQAATNQPTVARTYRQASSPSTSLHLMVMHIFISRTPGGSGCPCLLFGLVVLVFIVWLFVWLFVCSFFCVDLVVVVLDGLGWAGWVVLVLVGLVLDGFGWHGLVVGLGWTDGFGWHGFGLSEIMMTMMIMIIMMTTRR